MGQPDRARVMHRKAPYALAFAIIVGIYALLHTKYRVYYVDDAWCLSYVYNYAFHGIDVDTLVRPPGHPRSVLYFGKLSSILYSSLLDVLGWTKSSGHLVSTLFLFLASTVWGATLRALNFSFELAVTVALGLLVFPAFFSSANLTRPDTLAFLCASLALFLFAKGRYALSGFFCVAATEVHIMGCTSGFYVLACAVHQRQRWRGERRRLLKDLSMFVGGVALGCAYYYALHAEYFEFWTAFRAITQHSSMSFPVKNYMAAYFFGADWLQKLPELVFTVGMLVLFFWRLRARAHPFVRTFLIVMLASTLVTSRPNSNYMLFAQPALVLAFAHSFDLLGRLQRYAAAVLAYFILYYGVIGFKNRDFDHQAVTDDIRSTLSRPELPVIGMMDNWFAAMDRTFYPIYPSATAIEKRKVEEAYLIRNDYVRALTKNYASTMEYMQRHFELTPLKRIPTHGPHVAEVYLAKKKSEPSSAAQR